MANRQYFRIEGEAVHLVSETIQRTVKLGDLLGEIAKEKTVTTPMLPLGCRMYSQREGRSIFVIEQAPITRQVVWSGMDNNGNEKWKLALPYVVFVVVFSGEAVSTGECRVFYRTSPLGNGDEKIFRPNLCNVYAQCTICTGSARVEGTSLAQKAESFVAAFWGSRFNGDLYHENFGPASQSFPQVATLAKWQEESAVNPLFPLGIQWFEFGRLADVVEGGCNNGPS